MPIRFLEAKHLIFMEYTRLITLNGMTASEEITEEQSRQVELASFSYANTITHTSIRSYFLM